MQAAGQVQRGSGEGFGRLWCRRQVKFNKVPEKGDSGAGARSGSTAPGGFGGSGSVPEKVLEKVPEKVSEKVPGGFGAEPGQVQRAPEGCHRRFWESLVKGKVRFNGFNRVSSAWLRSTLQNDL